MLSAVIAKLQVTSCRSFGSSGGLTILNCVCENDLMAAYAEAEEDRCFTKYSPWGEAQFGGYLGSGNVELLEGQKFYAIVLRGVRPACAKAATASWKPERRTTLSVRAHAVTDYGDGQAKRIEICNEYNEPVGFNWKMSIDNPPAVEFFEPGKTDYWVAFYPADHFTRDTALADALADA